MRVSGVAFRQFPPFSDAEVEFPRATANSSGGEVQLLTGQNGTGKTRLLCLLAAACGNRTPLDARLEPTTKSNISVLGEHGTERVVWLRGDGHAWWFRGPDAERQARENFRAGSHNSSIHQTQMITSRGGADSLAAAFAFRGMARVSEMKISALASLMLGPPADHLTFEPAKNEDQIICQSMSNLKMAAAMDALRLPENPDSRDIRIMQRLEGAVTRITGRNFSFDVTSHPEVRLRVFWGGVPMRLPQLPDGLRSIIGWLVSCVAKLNALFPEHQDPLGVPLILLLDEPEGHLHPAWQRKILPAAQTLFPKAQIIAATHSPFVISSVNEGWIHIFRADEAGVVKVDKPIPCDKGDTYLDVVEEILGVKEWYDPETETLLAEFRQTRDDIMEGRGDYDKLAKQAKMIAARSPSLCDLMAREMRQVERLKGQVANHP